MKIVIDLPEELTAKDKFYTDKEVRTIIKSVQNGTPLPKHHGRLKDVDKIIDELKKWWREEELQDLMDAPTIIGADEEGGKDDSTS